MSSMAFIFHFLLLYIVSASLQLRLPSYAQLNILSFPQCRSGFILGYLEWWEGLVYLFISSAFHSSPWSRDRVVLSLVEYGLTEILLSPFLSPDSMGLDGIRPWEIRRGRALFSMSNLEAPLALLWPEWSCLLPVISINGKLDCGRDSVQLHPGFLSVRTPW